LGYGTPFKFHRVAKASILLENEPWGEEEKGGSSDSEEEDSGEEESSEEEEEEESGEDGGGKNSGADDKMEEYGAGSEVALGKSGNRPGWSMVD
jgi:hypothetical protein